MASNLVLFIVLVAFDDLYLCLIDKPYCSSMAALLERGEVYYQVGGR
jgi:hypothetical protein